MRVAFLGLFSAFLAVSAVGFAGCVGDSPATGDAGKPMGDEGGPCFSNFTCNMGLVCNLGPNICVKPGTDGAIVDTGTDSPSGQDTGTEGGCPVTLGNTIAWWTADNTPNDHFGAHNLQLWDAGAPAYTTGEIGKAFDLGGANLGYYAAAINLGTVSNLTVEFWIQIANVPQSTQTVMQYTDAQSAPIFSIGFGANSKNLTLTMPGVSISSQISTGSFHHVAFVYGTGGMAAAFLDGTQSMTSNAAPAQLSPGQDLFIGAQKDGTGAFQGQLDEIAMYRVSLLGMDIQNIFKAGAAGVCRTN